MRPAVEFAAGHPLDATNIPLSELEDSWHELPPKGSQLDLLANPEQAQDLEQIFERQDYQIRDLLFSDQVSQDEWFQDSVSKRLWRANPLLESYIDLIKANLASEEPLAFDVASGSGRDSVFLSLHGFKVLALDNNPYALQRLDKFRQRWQANVQSQLMDLQADPESFGNVLKKKQPQLIMQARYLHRPLLDIYQQELTSGAILAIHTFNHKAATFGKPKNPAYLLQDNELSDKFSDWEILLDDEHKLADGRPLSLFLAKKP